MPFQRFVEIGRVALVNYGKMAGSLVVIVDVVDASKALVDAPGILRQTILFKRLKLTDLKVEIERCPKPKVLVQALKDADIAGKWAKSNWGKKLAAQSAKAGMNDLDRYKKMVLACKRSAAIRDVMAGKKVPPKPSSGAVAKARSAPPADPMANRKTKAAVHAAAAGFFRNAGM